MAGEAMAPIAVTAAQLGIEQGDEYDGPVDYDLGNLAAFAPAPVDLGQDGGTDEACRELATKITQGLVARLFALPSAPAPTGRLALLPEPATPLPRGKPLPKPREPTRWEKFAQRKGIVKHKRSKLAFDEGAGEWRRRYGYKRVNDAGDVAVLEAKPDDQVGADPFTTAKREKTARVASNEQRRLHNLKSNAKAGGALPPTLRLAAALPEHGKGRPVKRKELRGDIVAASRQAGVSTASMGKFDELVRGEKPGERAPAGKRRKFGAVAGGAGERGAVSGLVDKIVRHNADDIVDADRAAGLIEAERRAARHKEKVAAAQAGAAAGGGKGGKGKKYGAGGTKKGQGYSASKGGPRAAAGGVKTGGKGGGGKGGKGGKGGGKGRK